MKHLSLAQKLVIKMKRLRDSRVVDFNALLAGKAIAEELQGTVVTAERLKDYHPAHALYIYAQNQASVMSEQLTSLDEMDPFVKLIEPAEDSYMPSGPPMSPLTASYFTCWAFFDACVGPTRETLGTVMIEVGRAFGMHENMLRLLGDMQRSRMGVYGYEGTEQGLVSLRELATGERCHAVLPVAHQARVGELWYARVLPPPLGRTEHVVFTAPYVLIQPNVRAWMAYFDRVLPAAASEVRVDAYQRHMKYGPKRNYWNDFVLEAYVNHTHNAIFLAGIPDILQSRPHYMG